MNFVCFNGKMLSAGKPVLMADNRGYRYGDGLFETMKMFNGQILLEKYHFERLYHGMKLLKFRPHSTFKPAQLRKAIQKVALKNKCEKLARVRLSVFRGNGGLYDEVKGVQWLVECWPVDPSVNQLNRKGLVIDVFPGIQKTCDPFANLKTANFLPYVMAAKYARESKVDDCLVNNTEGRIADTTVANIFLVKNNLVITPALSEGCVGGVMRKYLIEKMKQSGLDLREGVVTKNDLETFDEIFLTNAMYGLKWVKRFRKKQYGRARSTQIYNDFIRPLYL